MVAVSQKRILEYRKEYCALDTAGAFRKAVELAEQLIALDTFLFEEHRRSLAELLREVVASGSSRPGGTTKPPRSSASAAVKSPAKSTEMVPCPECSSKVRADRLAKHLLTKHQTTLKAVQQRKKTPTEPKPKPQPTRKALRAQARNHAKTMVICRECKRRMPREDYTAHVCRLQARGPVLVQGGAPGMRR